MCFFCGVYLGFTEHECMFESNRSATRHKPRLKKLQDPLWVSFLLRVFMQTKVNIDISAYVQCALNVYYIIYVLYECMLYICCMCIHIPYYVRASSPLMGLKSGC